jgi:hypothetical protein
LKGLFEVLPRFPSRRLVADTRLSLRASASFRQINKQTGNRLRRQLVDVVTGEPVQTHNKGRGYEVGENHFLLVRDQELEAAEEEGRSRLFSSVPAKSTVQHDAAPARR